MEEMKPDPDCVFKVCEAYMVSKVAILFSVLVVGYAFISECHLRNRNYASIHQAEWSDSLCASFQTGDTRMG